MIEGERKIRQNSSATKGDAPINIETVPSVVMKGPMIRRTGMAGRGIATAGTGGGETTGAVAA